MLWELILEKLNVSLSMVITVSLSEKAQAMVKFGGALNIIGLIWVSTHKSTGSTLAIKYGLDLPLRACVV